MSTPPPKVPRQLVFSSVPAAPYMLKNGTCSDCEQKFITAGNGDYKICPKCYAVLWHTDFGLEERRLRGIAAAAAKAMQQQTALKKAQKINVQFRAEDLVVSAPTLGVCDLLENAQGVQNQNGAQFAGRTEPEEPDNVD